MSWRRLIRFGRPDPAADVRAEIDAHLEMQVEELVAQGWRPDAAREEAARRFGDRQHVEREAVAIDRKHEAALSRLELLADLGRDLRQAARQLRRRPSFTLLAVLVTALGIGATSAVFAVVDIALLRPLPFPGADDLVFLWDDQHSGEPRISPSVPEFRDWQKADFLASATAIYGAGTRLRGADGWDVVDAAWVAGDPAGTTGIAPLLGRWFTADELRTGARVALLDERMWRGRFGAREDIVGQTITLGPGPHTVIGVLPREASLIRGLSRRAATDLWLPHLEEAWMVRGHHFLRVVGRLRPGVTLGQAQAAAHGLGQALQAAKVSDHGLVLESAREVLVGDTRPTLRVLAGATGFLVLIVCANLAGLFVTRFRERERELAIRVTLGAGPGSLIRLVVLESLIVGVLGAVAGVWLADALIAILVAAADRVAALAPSAGADARVILFTLALSLVVTMSVGALSALRATRVDPGLALKEAATQYTGGRRAARRRKLLVGGQLAVCFALLATTGLLVRSLARMLGEPTGFDAKNVLAMRVLLAKDEFDDARRRAFVEALDQRLRALPGVVAAGVGSELPLEGSDTTGTYQVVGKEVPEGSEPESKKRIVGPGYFEALGVPVLRGRGFTAADRDGARDVVIISESLRRRHWPAEDPIGRQVRFDWGPGDVQEIVGVVDDLRHDGLDQAPEPIMYRPIAQFPTGRFNLLVRADRDPLLLAEAVRRLVAEVDAGAATHEVRTVESIVARSTAPRRTLVLLLGGFALLALSLASVGVYSVVSLAVAQRTREIGLRMAIGAEPGSIVRLILGEATPTIAAGLAAGVVLTVAAGRLLQGMLYGVSPLDPPTLLAAALALAGVAAVAALIPARRAARLAPLDALR